MSIQIGSVLWPLYLKKIKIKDITCFSYSFLSSIKKNNNNNFKKIGPFSTSMHLVIKHLVSEISLSSICGHLLILSAKLLGLK